MEIKTITCHHVYNHGAMLQAYALTEFLKKEGHDVSIIDYRPPYLEGQFSLWKVDSRYKRMGLRLAYILFKLPGRIRALRRKKAFDRFFEKHIIVESKVFYSIEDLKAAPPKAELYIAGSDQIWNTEFKNGTDPAFYLDFGNCRKISYAASFATSCLREGTEEFVKEKLRNFNDISVREISALNILNCLGYHGTKVVDPVFLLSKEHWDIIATDVNCSERYVLVYDFEENAEIQSIVQRYAKLNKCKIYSIGPYRMKYPDKCFVDYGPDVFVALIKNALCVFSNSFHGSAFSIIYNKDFFIINRKDGLNIRMNDFLTGYKLRKRLINKDVKDEVLLEHINYLDVNKQIHSDIYNSINFLKRNII